MPRDKKLKKATLLLCFLCSILGYFQPQESKATPETVEPVKAFPEASGYGAESIGGRGGRVIVVDNLNDSGPGSLREALEAKDPRIVIFRTAGVIKLNSTIEIISPYLTVAGQTAPSPGITLRMDPSSESIYRNDRVNGDVLVKAAKDLIHVRTHDVIMRYLKLRRGDTKVNGRNLVVQTSNGNQFAHNVILDHMSFSWSTDESVDIYTSETADPERSYGIHHVTISNSIIAESLAQDCLNWLNPDLATHTVVSIEGDDANKVHYTYSTTTDFPINKCVRFNKGKYSFDIGGTPAIGDNIHPLAMVIGGFGTARSWHKVRDIDLHHNLFAHNTHRNPRVKAHGIKVVNNFIYNWFTRASETMLSTEEDYIGNIFYHGPVGRFPATANVNNEQLIPNTDPSKVYRKRFLFHDNGEPLEKAIDSGLGSLYLSENIAPLIESMQDNGNDNWFMLLEELAKVPLPIEHRRNLPLGEARFPIIYTTPNMENKFDLMEDVGANQLLACDGSWISSRDFVDQRVVNEAFQKQLTTIDTVSAIYKTAREAGPLIDKTSASGKIYKARPDPYSGPDPYQSFNPTNPVSPCTDTDNDGMPDAWELRYGSNIALAANTDEDHDGYTNIEEYINGLDSQHGVAVGSSCTYYGEKTAHRKSSSGALPCVLYNGVPMFY